MAALRLEGIDTGLRALAEGFHGVDPERAWHLRGDQAPTTAGSAADAWVEAQVVTDDFGVVEEASDAAAELLGTSAFALRGRALATLVVGAHGRRFRDAVTQLRREGSVEVELALDAAQGGAVEVTMVAARAHDVGGLVWTLRRELPRSGACLTSEAAERASEALAIAPHDPLPRGLDTLEQRLEATQRRCAELVYAQQARELQLAVVAHELRGPTAAILGWTRLLRHPRADASQRERAIAVIEENALHQRALIEDLMEAVRLAGHKVTIERAPVDLGEVASHAVESAQPKAVEKQVALTCQVIGEVRVAGDARRLSQVVTNLVANAIKFTPPDGRVAVRVSATDGAATLRVSDSGLGIARLDLPRVFDRFHQGTHPGRIADGIGLGLFLVREIVEMHGGGVTAESAGPCLGATFTVTLPLEG